jgi:hypothetical protein
MDGSAAIERNRVALVRIVATLVAMAGLRQSAIGNRQSDKIAVPETGDPAQSPTADCPLPTAPTLPRHLWRAILRLLRPAESAARRLIIAAARGMTPPPPRFTQSPSPASQGVSGRFAEGKSVVPVARWKAGERRVGAEHRAPGRDGAGEGGVVTPLPSPRRLALPLFDRLRRVGPRPLASRDLPRISVPGWTERLPVPVRHEPSPDDPINAARLALRLDALARALDDLPKQARRFARWQAASNRAAAGAQIKDHAAAVSSPPSIGGEVVRCADRSGGRMSLPNGPARFRRLSPLRGGPPPGIRRGRSGPAHRKRDIREIDDILAHAHELALFALERPDTS